MPRKGHCLLALALVLGLGVTAAAEARRFPSIVVVTVDTLRSDYLSGYGHPRQTSPHLDRLLAESIRFDEARTVEPLTNPALISLFTSLYPHQHGASRNGIRMRPGLTTLPGLLRQRGFATAAFVGNWTLKNEISGLGDHFAHYEEIFSRKRWLVFKGEATAEDLTDAALAWTERTTAADADRPFLLWVHYVEPHAPYRTQTSVLDQLGYSRGDRLGPRQRYETEVAYVDRSIGHLLAEIDRLVPTQDTVVVFASDHGENLGEKGHWGHGRHLWEPQLRVPMSIRWKGRLPPGRVVAPASILDLAPTMLTLLGHPLPANFRGFDWAPVLRREAPAPVDRPTYFEAHRGAVHPVEDARHARRRGLLKVGVLRGDLKEILVLERGELLRFELDEDPGEQRGTDGTAAQASPELLAWRQRVVEGLVEADSLPPPEVDAETAERMRSLGYLD
jgi:arylsulfatase A-like enzyme